MTTITETPAPAVAIKDVKIRKGFNPRQELQGVTELAASMKLIGVLVPILIDTEGYLVDGHRRLAAAKKAGLAEIPCATVTATEGLNGAGSITAAAAANVARDQLTPAEEADAIQRMLNAGLTPEGAAQALGISQNRVTRRLELLKVPEAARELWGGEHPANLDAVPAAAALLEKVPAIAPHVAYAHRCGHEIEDLVRDPGNYIDGVQNELAEAVDDDAPEWPKTVAIVNADAHELHIDTDQTLGINVDHIKRYKKAWADGRAHYVYGIRLTFNDTDIDAARAAGVLVELEHKLWDGRARPVRLIVDKEWIKDRIENTVLPRYEKAMAAAVKKEQKSRGRLPAGAGDDDKAAAAEKAKLLKQREKEKEWAGLAHDANLDLGRELLNKLAKTKLTVDVARFFAETSLGCRPDKGSTYDRDDAIKLAAAGLRYVMPGWQTEVPKPTKAQPDKTKTVWLEPKEAEKRLWEWFDAAKTPEEILGRALVIHAAARWAVENCVAQSSRHMSNHGSTLTMTRSVVPVGPAREALDRISEPLLPQSIKDLIADIRKGAKR